MPASLHVHRPDYILAYLSISKILHTDFQQGHDMWTVLAVLVDGPQAIRCLRIIRMKVRDLHMYRPIGSWHFYYLEQDFM